MAEFEIPDVGDIFKKGGSLFFDLIQFIVVIFAIFAVIYLFVTSPHEVVGRSMDPNFAEGQFLLADKISYRMRTPEQGEVVIFKQDETHDYIKRVIGVPGDTVEIKNGKVYINGSQLNETNYLESSVNTDYGSYMTRGRRSTVEEGMVFVLGDNRPHSSDSRDFGSINNSQIKGRAVFRLTPLSEFGRIKTAEY